MIIKPGSRRDLFNKKEREKDLETSLINIIICKLSIK